MNDSPIFDHMTAAVREGEQLAQRARDALARLLHHNQEGTPAMGVMDDVVTRVNEVVANIKAEVAKLEGEALPVIHDGAQTIQRLSVSPIVAEVQALMEPLDPQLEQFIAGLIRTAGDAAAKVAELTAAAQPPAEVPAEAEAEPPAA